MIQLERYRLNRGFRDAKVFRRWLGSIERQASGSAGCKYSARTPFVRAYWQAANKDRIALQHIPDAANEIRRGNKERGVPSLKAVESWHSARCYRPISAPPVLDSLGAQHVRKKHDALVAVRGLDRAIFAMILRQYSAYDSVPATIISVIGEASAF